MEGHVLTNNTSCVTWQEGTSRIRGHITTREISSEGKPFIKKKKLGKASKKRRKKGTDMAIYAIVYLGHALFYIKITCRLESGSVLQPDEARTPAGETHSSVAF